MYLAGRFLEVAGLRGPDPALRLNATVDHTLRPHGDARLHHPPHIEPAQVPNSPLTSASGSHEAPHFTSRSFSARDVAGYYSAPQRQYGGKDDESAVRARQTYNKVCDAFGAPHDQRASCVRFAVKPSDHNLPELINDTDGYTADELWDLTDRRVNSTSRATRIGLAWSQTTLAKDPVRPGDTNVMRFERLVGRLSLLQSQMPAGYHTANMLTDKIMDAGDGEWFEAMVIPDAGGDPHILASRIKLMLTTGPPTVTPAR